MNSVERQIQLCLHKIQNWADENGFEFSKIKAACVHSCTKRKPHNDPCILLDENQIKVVIEAQF